MAPREKSLNPLDLLAAKQLFRQGDADKSAMLVPVAHNLPLIGHSGNPATRLFATLALAANHNAHESQAQCQHDGRRQFW